MSHSSLAIANEFIRRAAENDARPLTNMQIQKLVYLAHGWNLGACGEPLIEDPVEAWKFGPVVRRLYAALSRYGNSPVTSLISWGDDTILYSGDDGDEAYEELEEGENNVIDLVWRNYGKYPAFKLSALTHQPNTPWSQTFALGSNRVIPNALIEDHFRRLMAPA